MNLEKLYRKDLRLIFICTVVGAVSLWVGVKYFFQAFPEASIDFRTTRESSEPIARDFLSRLGLDPSGYRHAAIFDFEDEAKIFLEREVGVESSAKLLDSTIRLWRWEHRWFRPLQKEELQVEITTKGEPVGFRHLLSEDAPGPDLPAEQARPLAEQFLVSAMHRPLDTLAFVEGTLQKRPHRTDHTFTWKLEGSEVKGADYRLEVGVAGDRVSSYEEFLKIPDTWQRDYKNLRAWNTAASLIDAMFLLLTFVAMLVLLAMKIRGYDIRWRPAGILAAVTFVLQTLSALNSLPSDLYSYDTTSSFGGFLVERVLLAVVWGLSYGAAIFLIAAAAEPLYRDRFPRFLSLTALLRPRAFRTKEFFVSALVGITLTLFFFAYENVFYIIANSLGAWAPREVAYSDLLSTAFPWVFVLFFGWFPAISEEFISRMFSIPFLEHALRSRALAIVIAAFIWGFGHAAYPNQPFWIRGLEVGLAGIIFGLVMIRFGIAAVVICHFSVDALYTAFVLIRSHDLYYVLSGGLAAGIFGILFLAAVAAYFVKGGFLPPELTNAADRAAPEGEIPRDESGAVAGAMASAEGPGRWGRGAAARMPERGAPTGTEVAGREGTEMGAREGAEIGVREGSEMGGRPERRPGMEEAERAGSEIDSRTDAEEGLAGRAETTPSGQLLARPWYEAWTGRRIGAALAIAAAFVALGLIPFDRYGAWTNFKTTRERARESASTFLRGCGFDVSAYKSAAAPLDRTDRKAAAYLLETGGLSTVNDTYRERVPTPIWRVRFFIPGQHEELAVSIDPRSGAALGFERTLPEDAPGATLDKDEALALAEKFATARGQDPKAGELKEQSEKDEKARRDHTLVWEYPIEHGGDAKVRYEIVVQGDVVGSWTRGVKVPEEWERERSRQTVLFTILRYLKIPFIGVLAGLAVVILVMRIRDGAIPWRYALVIGAAGAIAVTLTTVLGLGAVWLQYDTSIPEPLFLVGIAVSIIVVFIFVFLMGIVVGGLVGSLFPEARAMFSRPGRRLYARDALIAGVVCLGFALGLPALTRLLALLVPSGRLIEGVSMSESLAASVPFLHLLSRLFSRTIFLPALGGILVALLARYFRSGLARMLVGALFVVSFLPSSARRPAEFLFAALSLIVLAGGAGALALLFLRDNPLAWVWGTWFSLGYLASKELLEQSAFFYRANGAIAMVLVLVPALLLLRDAMTGGSTKRGVGP